MSIFQKIINREIPANIVFEDEYVLAFKDIAPKAPVHILVIPKTDKIRHVDDITPDNSVYISKIFEAIPIIAKKSGLVNGYRVITNCKSDAGQEVYHIHFHILGGREMEFRC